MSYTLAEGRPLNEDVIRVNVGIKIDGLPVDAPLCRELGLMLVASGREEDVISDIRELVGVPEEFEVQVGLADPELLEPPPMVEPSDMTDLTIQAQGCVECSAYSWSKGCSSWPW